MPLIIKEDPSQYPLPSEGLHHGVCVDAVDLGELDTPFGRKHKLSLIWELKEIDDDGSHYIVGKRYTWSLNEKANLRKDLERWRGGKFSPEQLQGGIDLEEFIGVNATLFITHNVTEERTFANVESILPFKNEKGELDPYQFESSGEYVRVIEREGYLKPEEYAESVNGSK
ncbi:phage replication initiation protein, NGO0469 family [Natronogracilivirga saccharolytica]|uniref:Uncharacterized protein n=1 Tax=Natronogracilivirga saccharolytica TaxID=2812953 RepID=A0A8J7RLD7_9BACT|nr:hypothetical protein [Natronogracilivirga saccharolytica]MBP3192975.1 hypothetical protein [Natronogracilivirga saccharolytica]